MLCCSVLYHTIPYRTISDRTIPHYTVLYGTVRNQSEPARASSSKLLTGRGLSPVARNILPRLIRSVVLGRLQLWSCYTRVLFLYGVVETFEYLVPREFACTVIRDAGKQGEMVAFLAVSRVGWNEAGE